ncbi:MAG: tRNA (adenosine(37)-N6)-threonylcarbamoyltransferase complex ATPase subunit type 1 TsaE [Alphaproteobacteria bacterium]
MAETLLLNSLDDTRRAAQAFARTLKRGDVVALSGELGTGKTTFVQDVVRCLSDTDAEVTSPTFTLLQTYPVRISSGEAITLHHFDLYRIASPRELAELGLEEAFAELALIEWPERLSDKRAFTHWLTFGLLEGAGPLPDPLPQAGEGISGAASGGPLSRLRERDGERGSESTRTLRIEARP